MLSTATTTKTIPEFFENKSISYDGISKEKLNCTKDGVSYADLEQVPSGDCNNCFCDFGNIVCSER